MVIGTIVKSTQEPGIKQPKVVQIQTVEKSAEAPHIQTAELEVPRRPLSSRCRAS